jgi:RNA polymerase sigma-70 factor (ECF subfamily)
MTDDFARIYDDHVWQVYGFFAYRVGSRLDAEDLTQQTFERALRAWGRFDARRSAPATWLLAIARNLLIDHFRAGRGPAHEPIGEEGVPEEALPGVEDAGVDLGLDPALARALAELSGRDREVLALRFGGDRTGPEIAEMLDLSLANVQQILSRSLRRLRAALEAADAVG